MKFRSFVFVSLAVAAPFTFQPGSATHDPNDFFALEAEFPGVIWEDIHGTSATSLFAVGRTGTGMSAIATRASGSWALQTVPDAGSLGQVWVSSTSLAFAISDTTTPDGTLRYVLRWGGASWTIDTPILGADTVVGKKGIWGVSSTNAEAGVYQALVSDVRNFNGAWTGATATCPTTPLAGVSFSDMFARGTTYSYWVKETVGLRLFEIASPYTSCTDVFIESPSTDVLNDIWGDSASLSDYWSVGQAGEVRHGTTSIGVASSTTTNLNAVWGTSQSDIWAVGDSGTIIHKAVGDTWTAEPPLAQENNLRGVYCSDASNCWIVSSIGNIFKLQVNPNTGLPSLAGLQWDPNDMIVYAEDACLGDEVELTVNLEPSLGAGGLNWYVINSDTNIVVETGTAAQFTVMNNKHFHTSRGYPSGDYTFVVTADVVGLLTPDNWAGEGFNVDTGSCFTTGDSLLIQNRFDQVDSAIVSLQNDVEYVNQTTLRIDRNETNDFVYTNNLINATSGDVQFDLSYTNGLINTTSSTTQAMVTSAHAHIDAHFQYTNGLFNTTFEDAIFNITIGSGIANQTVKLLANEFGLQLGETSTLNILIILAMVVIGVWMYRKRDHDLPIRLTGVLIVLTAGVIALATATAWSGGIVFAFLVIVFAVGLMLYGLMQVYREKKNGKRTGELEL